MDGGGDNHPTEVGVPPCISEQAIIFDIDFHPSQHVIACGMVTGVVNVYKYGLEANQNWRVTSLKYHKDSCRAVSFTPDGKYLYTGSVDRSIRAVDCATGSVAWTQHKSHNAAVNCLKCLNERHMASGDDDGHVKLWDLRSNQPVHEFSENTDFISDMAIAPDNRMLITTSGDGYLTVLDLRKGKLEAMSDELDDELLSVVIVKRGNKVVCGSQSGMLSIFTYGNWGDMDDRMSGHPQSVDTLVALDENILFTGSSDGMIRVVNIHPNRVLGVLGEHGEFPIEKLALSYCKSLVASSSHDQTIRFWDANVHGGHVRPDVPHAPENLAENQSDEEMNDDDDDDDDDEGDDDDEEGEGEDDSDSDSDLSSEGHAHPEEMLRAAKKNLGKRNNFFSGL